MSVLPTEYQKAFDLLLSKVAAEARDPKAEPAVFWPMKGDRFEPN